MSALRIAFVGAGSVAERHARVLGELGGVELVGVHDAAATSAERFAAATGGRVFGSVDDLLDGTSPDAVYVCVPPFAHGEAETAALDRGLPFFVEKPIGANLGRTEEIARRVEEQGVVTGTGYHWRCLDVVDRARDLLADAPPVLAAGYWLDKRPPVAWWAVQERSGGQVVEQLTHVLDLARVLLGEPVEVYAAGARMTEASPEDDVDDATAATVRFSSGAVATFAATSVLVGKHRAGLHLYGPAGVVEVSEDGLTVDQGGSRHTTPPTGDPRVAVDREFLEALRGERAATRAPYGEALRTHLLGCAIASSARTGEAVRLEPAGVVR